MRVLDLFSGIGGFSLGLERAGFETVAFCEIEKFPQAVLRKHWPDVPIYDDIRTLTVKRLQNDGIGTIDVICGGFPCQPFSVAGRRKGTADDRDLWPEMFRLIQECKPTWVIGENVAGFVDMAFERTALNLESEGYEVQPIIIPACAIGAPHRRDRIWIIAYSKSNGNIRNPRTMGEKIIETKKQKYGAVAKCASTSGDGIGECGQPDSQKTLSITNATSAGLERVERSINEGGGKGFTNSSTGVGGGWREIKPTICRGDNGLPHRMDRLKALGNAVVPQIPEMIGRAIMGQKNVI